MFQFHFLTNLFWICTLEEETHFWSWSKLDKSTLTLSFNTEKCHLSSNVYFSSLLLLKLHQQLKLHSTCWSCIQLASGFHRLDLNFDKSILILITVHCNILFLKRSPGSQSDLLVCKVLSHCGRGETYQEVWLAAWTHVTSLKLGHSFSLKNQRVGHLVIYYTMALLKSRAQRL